MKYLSVCSGMEAASVAWEPLGWKPVGFSEIEPFPCAILKHRFPNTPNYGSLTEYQSWPVEPGAIDLLVGGTPCQSFSVAGLRKGLADPRGNLALTFLGLADKLKPKWIVWENVPGVLSSGGGRDFGSFLGALVELGYGFAYRVLDAQYVGGPRAVPQRRRRVFVVACLGDWRAPAEVLSLREGLRGYLEAGGKKRKGPAADAGSGVEAGCWWDGGQVSQTLDAVLQKGQTMPEKNRFPAVLQPYTASSFAQYAEGVGTVRASGWDLGGGSETLLAQPRSHWEGSDIHPTLNQSAKGSGGVGASNQELFSQGGAYLVPGAPIPIQDGREMEKNQNGMGVGKPGDPAYTIDTTGAQAAGIPFRKSKRACSTTDNESWVPAEQSNTLNNFDLGDTRTTHAVVEPIAIQGTIIGRGENAGPQGTGATEGGPMFTLTKTDVHGVAQPFAWTQNQRDEVRVLGDKAGALALPGTHQTNYIAEPKVYENHPNDSRVTGPHEVCPTVVSRFGTGGGNVPLVNNEPIAITFQPGNLRREAGAEPSTTTTTTLKASAGDQTPHVATPMAVRRLTPTECERLQGFPDNWSRIPWKGKPETECPDGPRYKACGNSMAVPCMFWIGKRIAEVEAKYACNKANA